MSNHAKEVKRLHLLTCPCVVVVARAAAAALFAPARVLTPVVAVVRRKINGDLMGGAGMSANPLLTTSGIPSGSCWPAVDSTVSVLPLCTRTLLA